MAAMVATLLDAGQLFGREFYLELSLLLSH